jgi:hypothetical protein
MRDVLCPTCNGRGTVDPQPGDPLAVWHHREECPTCHYRGVVASEKDRRGLGNVGPGKSGVLPAAAPKPGDFAKGLSLSPEFDSYDFLIRYLRFLYAAK